jgi:hypothetical protein
LSLADPIAPFNQSSIPGQPGKKYFSYQSHPKSNPSVQLGVLPVHKEGLEVVVGFKLFVGDNVGYGLTVGYGFKVPYSSNQILLGGDV